MAMFYVIVSLTSFYEVTNEAFVNTAAFLLGTVSKITRGIILPILIFEEIICSTI